ncbi:MAG: hypothetical protein LBE18_06495 [Planctomycetaceae bacterium]|jgi:hypothetical protein|nr:hypothetical protein [Planctomycetaceae bacterium]
MFFSIKNISTGLFWTGQFIFWLASCLAVLNRFWAGVGSNDYCIASMMGCWVAIIFLFLHLLKPNDTCLSFGGRNWLSAIGFGVQLQADAFLIYVLIIIVTEIVWNFWLRKLFIERNQSDKNYQQSAESIVNKPNEVFENRVSNIDIDIEQANENSAIDEFDNLSSSIWQIGKTQHIIRHKTELGEDKFEGYFRVEFDENQLTVSIHVPFYPVFERLPTVDAYLVDVEDAKLTITGKQFFGVRIDVKRANKNVNNLKLAVIATG